MITVTFNHYLFDDPYKQTTVEQGFRALERYVDELGEHLYYSFVDKGRSTFIELDYTDEVIFVYHTAPLEQSQKQRIVDCLRNAVALKKTVYKGDYPNVCIIFEKVNTDNCFEF